MPRFVTGGAVAVLALAACGFAGQASAQSYDRLVVFGDSLSDNGNLYLASGGTTPASPMIPASSLVRCWWNTQEPSSTLAN